MDYEFEKFFDYPSRKWKSTDWIWIIFYAIVMLAYRPVINYGSKYLYGVMIVLYFMRMIPLARAFSALSLWVVYLCWGAIIFFIDADAIFDNVKTMVAVLLGFQSTMELGAGIYYQKKMDGSKE